MCKALLKPAEALKILIVDDAPDNLRLLVKILEAQHFTVRKARSGKVALQAARLEPPDLILLDINMPEMDGFAVCEQLKASATTANIPVIFLSALDQSSDKVRAFASGGQDYITKPFQELEVLARVNNQLLLQQQREQLAQKNQQLESLYQQVQTLNTHLEFKVQQRTAQLQQALDFEATLKRITDQVRDSLDEAQILQHVVRELALVLQADSCDLAFYDAARTTTTVNYEYSQDGCTAANAPYAIAASSDPQLYVQLFQGHSVHFCLIKPNVLRPEHSRKAILACPLMDDQGILGDMWLFKPAPAVFDEPERHLVQQVANQCAIALRQARLYQAAQAQVRELARLNQLKDDFLSTVSHELRTPMSSIKMATQMLELSLQHLGILDDATSAIPRYFNILREEGMREMRLINDLLDLARLDAETEPLTLTTIDLQHYLPHLAETLSERLRQHQQHFALQLPDVPLPCTTDLPYLERILTELLQNACKYTPAGETITLAAQAQGAALALRVSNTGVEIPPAECERIFDKFYRIPNNDPWKHGGTGLGLALVQKLTARLGGQIQVESGKGQTTFVLALRSDGAATGGDAP